MRHQIIKSPNLFFVGTRNPPSSGFQEIKKKTSPGHWNIKEHHVLWFHLRKEWLWFATGFSHVVYLRPTKKNKIQTNIYRIWKNRWHLAHLCSMCQIYFSPFWVRPSPSPSSTGFHRTSWCSTPQLLKCCKARKSWRKSRATKRSGRPPFRPFLWWGGGGVLLATWFIQGILNSGFP